MSLKEKQFRNYIYRKHVLFSILEDSGVDVMADIMLYDEYLMIQQAYESFERGQISEAIVLALEVENRSASFEDESKQEICLKYVAPCLIDFGFAVKDKEMITRGVLYLRSYIEKYDVDKKLYAYELYNLANGYFSSWEINAVDELRIGNDSEELQLSRKYYRMALAYLQFSQADKDLACHLYTNYGNVLDILGRAVEAVDAYNNALAINPNMGMALGNKAIALLHLASVTHGLAHRYYLEALRLLEIAVKQSVTPEARATFQEKIVEIRALVEAHNHKMEPEELVELVFPKSDFHSFLCDFCARFGLFLSPVTMLGEEEKRYFGDPMYIDHMNISLDDIHRADRYITFLNEIKQDYVLGRYFLVQSQFSLPELDAVDDGVLLVYPLDYSLHSVYIQLLKAALKQAISVLDKVAYFLYDYCQMKSPAPNKVSFLQLWGGSEKLPKHLRSYNNLYLLALFYLSRDVAKSGDWNFIYEQRNAVTHRFLVIHDLDLGEQQSNSDIPRVQEQSFTNQVILATKIARAAVMYLILFVALEEKKLNPNDRGLHPTIHGTILDEGFRHRPRN